MAGEANLIDQFVETLNEQGLEPLFDKDVPPELRTKLTDITDMYEWRIQPAERNPWVEVLEQKLPYPFPNLYHKLLSRYRFAEFEVGPICFLANTGTPVFNELADYIFRDKGLSPPLLERGLIQFGKAAGESSYDPFCFDMQRRANNDAPIVRIDHEDVLIRNRIRVLDEIAPSFAVFVRRVVTGAYSTHNEC